MLSSSSRRGFADSRPSLENSQDWKVGAKDVVTPAGGSQRVIGRDGWGWLSLLLTQVPGASPLIAQERRR
jgi:hypothetical protein